MSMFIHELTRLSTPLDETMPDDYGQPVAGTPVETTVMGLVQPRVAREQADHRSAGAEIADHVIFIPGAIDLQPADAFVFAGERYEILGIRRFGFGGLAHYEIDARRSGAPLVATEVGS